MGAPRARALCLNFGGALDFQTGHWDAAEANLRAAVELYTEVGSASGESLSLQRLGVVLTARGKLDEARHVLEAGLVVADRAAMRSHCLTRLHASMIRNRLAAHDRTGLEVSLADGLAAARRHGRCATCSALLLPEVIGASIELGAIDEAESHLTKLESTAAGFDSKAWTAMAAQARGRVRAARGDHAEAMRDLELAREAFQAADQPYEVAQCIAQQAVSARAMGLDEAEALAQTARALLAKLGAPSVVGL